VTPQGAEVGSKLKSRVQLKAESSVSGYASGKDQKEMVKILSLMTKEEGRDIADRLENYREETRRTKRLTFASSDRRIN